MDMNPTETVLDNDDQRTEFYESCGENVNTSQIL